jgi:hypothetical protein
MEAVRSSENMPNLYKTAWRHIPENSNVQSLRSGNLEFNIIKLYSSSLKADCVGFHVLRAATLRSSIFWSVMSQKIERFITTDVRILDPTHLKF